MDSTKLPSGCGVCGSHNNLFQCNKCQIMPYCSQEHEAADRGAHEQACTKILENRINIESEECGLPFTLEDFMSPSEDLQRHPSGRNGDGRRRKRIYWQRGADERAYLAARCGLLKAISKIWTRESLQVQLTQVLALLRLSPRDPLGLRRLAPVLMLLLGQDRECYDFMKGWSMGREGRDNDNAGPRLRGQTIDKSDFFEPVDFVHDLAHTIILTLLKIKIDKLYASVHLKNGYYWRALVSPQIPLDWKPDRESPGSLEEMQCSLIYTYDAWRKTPGAVDFIIARFHKKVQGRVQGGTRNQDRDEEWTLL
ncbi:uncharacterized protein BO80DRAFT_369161 [Aspergillus ibericus CBS 121593]|uniref:MYND-type domain-containing protein n=1 Tax=Aspergillus ibericus CBS 121593 TaxID=1448316 RepID=A0A395GIK2_9EURO|nr:hypothetical protein BO80DRAFT_369161 [Aspergillus ibericus CBS 121593]RAK95269.1 hypothetical protein BO80DRAFT_369161 [Aspergillus ibericus CBS 121593]